MFKDILEIFISKSRWILDIALYTSQRQKRERALKWVGVVGVYRAGVLACIVHYVDLLHFLISCCQRPRCWRIDVYRAGVIK